MTRANGAWPPVLAAAAGPGAPALTEAQSRCPTVTVIIRCRHAAWAAATGRHPH